MTQPLTLDRIVRKLPQKFSPENAAGLSAVFQFRITDAEPFYIDIRDGACQCCYGLHEDPSLVLHLDEATLVQIISGEQDGMSAFMKGRLRAEGNVMLATRLSKLFTH